jgi:DTW domain-containing protein YfiP
VAPVASRLELLILQHPLEAGNAKNSARLLHLCVQGSVLATGEGFDPAVLGDLLDGGGRLPVLLYPSIPGDAAMGIVPPPSPDPALFAAPERLRLVVVDATWRKSRKMLYLNPALQRLPRLSLDQVPPSSYRIRKAHAAHQLSTLEAVAYALAQLEGEGGGCNALLAAFDGFISQQAAFASRLK